jgi:hypothetical protein
MRQSKISLDGIVSPGAAGSIRGLMIYRLEILMKKFFSGFEKVTRTKIPDGLRIDVYVVSLGWKSRNILASVNTTAPVHPRDAG